jgi:hypothetical protein
MCAVWWVSAHLLHFCRAFTSLPKLSTSLTFHRCKPQKDLGEQSYTQPLGVADSWPAIEAIRQPILPLSGQYDPAGLRVAAQEGISANLRAASHHPTALCRASSRRRSPGAPNVSCYRVLFGRKPRVFSSEDTTTL